MYCPNCGNEIRNDDVFCPECGTPIENKKRDMAAVQPQQFADPLYQPPKTEANGTGAASLVLGLLGLLTLLIPVAGVILAPICDILAIIFSHMSRKRNGANGLATAGLVLGIISLVIVCIVIIVLIVAAVFVGSALDSFLSW